MAKQQYLKGLLYMTNSFRDLHIMQGLISFLEMIFYTLALTDTNTTFISNVFHTKVIHIRLMINEFSYRNALYLTK